MIRCEICQAKNVYFKYTVNTFNYYLCSSCQTLFLYPRSTEQDTDNYYKNHLDYSAGKKNEKRIRLQAKKIIRKLKKYYKNGKTLLDVGAGYGYFIDQAKTSGLETFGIEPAKKILKVGNKNILPLTLEAYIKKHKDKKFDYVTLIHVIEHLTNPKTAMAQTISMLKPKGILYIETPNLQSHLYNQEKNNYTFLTPPVHQWVYSKKSITSLLKNKKNIYIRNVTTYSYSEHFVKVIKSYFTKKTVKLETEILKSDSQRNYSKRVKYVFFDRIIAPLFTWTLNLFNKGTFLQIYIEKI